MKEPNINANVLLAELLPYMSHGVTERLRGAKLYPTRSTRYPTRAERGMPHTYHPAEEDRKHGFVRRKFRTS